MKKKDIEHFRDLQAYQLAFASAMKIYHISKSFPEEEKFSLVSQIRRSSRSVCSNLAEAWKKRKYMAVFKNKLTDSLQEASETQVWLEFSLACDFIDKELFAELDAEYEVIMAKINTMHKKAHTFCFGET